jgi:REP-associated tyrosine transposase
MRDRLEQSHPQRRQSTSGNWGGWRPGAGRKPKGEHAGVSHARRPRFQKGRPVILTLRVRPGLPSLRGEDAHASIRRALAESSKSRAFRVVERAIEPDHLHLLARANSARALARGMIGVSVRLARRLNRLWNRSGAVFADRYSARELG